MELHHLARWVLAAAVVSLAEFPSRAATGRSFACHGEPHVCATIVAGERDLTAMLVTGNTGAITRLFAADAVWTLGNGAHWTKREAIAAISHAPRSVSSRLVRADVRQFGNVAIVQWEERWRRSEGAEEERSIGTDTWLLRRASWQIIASQEARPPAKIP